MTQKEFSFIEKNYIKADNLAFFDELMNYRGEISTEAEERAWLDWAADITAERFNTSYDEGEHTVKLIESYYKQKEWI
jgi:hypothetical protein